MARPSDWSVLDLDKDPTPGDPSRIDLLADRFLEFSETAERAYRSVTSLQGDSAVMSWVGLSGDAFREHFGGFPNQLNKLYQSHQMVGDALTTYSPQLSLAQAQADRALADGREARAQLDSVSSQLTSAMAQTKSAGSHAEQLKNPDKSAPAPDPDQVAQAVRDAQVAQEQQSAAQGAVNSAQAALDAAKSLAEQARGLRKTAAQACAKQIDEGSDAGIQPRSFWQKLAEAFKKLWDIICEIAKWVALVAGIIAMIIGGPLAWVAFAAGVILLIKAVVDFAQGKGSVMDLVFGILGVIPGVKGLTSIGKLKELYRAGGLKAIGAHALANAKNILANLATVIRNGNLGAGIQAVVKSIINTFRRGDGAGAGLGRGLPDETTPLLDSPVVTPDIPAVADDVIPPISTTDDVVPPASGQPRPPSPDADLEVPQYLPSNIKPKDGVDGVYQDPKFPGVDLVLMKSDNIDPEVFRIGNTDELVYYDVDELKYMKYDGDFSGNPADFSTTTYPVSPDHFNVRGFETTELTKIDSLDALRNLPASDTPVLVKLDELSGISVRTDADNARIDSIIKAYNEGTPLGPIGLSRGDLTINDGNHRLEAARQLGLQYIPVQMGT